MHGLANIVAHVATCGGKTAESAFFNTIQAEMAERLHLPFAVLSDERFEFTDALKLPTFEVDGMRLLERLTMIVRGPRIEALFYPVSQPEQSAEVVVAWLKANPPPSP